LLSLAGRIDGSAAGMIDRFPSFGSEESAPRVQEILFGRRGEEKEGRSWMRACLRKAWRWDGVGI